MVKRPVIALINLGCSKNIVDSELMLGLLNKAGYEITLDEKFADIVLVNTCSFISNAEKESVKTIMELVVSYPEKKIIVTGCLPQKHGDELLDAIPELSAVIGTNEVGDIVDIVNKVVNNSSKQYCEISESITFLQNDQINRHYITVGPSSYIKIAEGCDWRCTYCLIPDLKGHYRSRTIESIVKEAQTLAENGTTEIVLIAQDTTSYGIDLYNKPALLDLLRELEKIELLSWIRLMYTYPKYLTDSLLDFIASSEKVLHYLDIPLQHAHPDILRAMKRPDVDVEQLLAKIRSKIPDISLRTCFIVGFPGETEEHFEYLYSFVKAQRFEKMGVFEYSKETRTPAAKIKPQITTSLKKKRRKLLMSLQQEISLKKNENLIDKTLPVLLENINSSGSATGRTYLDAPEIDGLVYIDSVIKSDYLPGDIIPVKITKGSAYDLYGVIDS